MMSQCQHFAFGLSSVQEIFVEHLQCAKDSTTCQFNEECDRYIIAFMILQLLQGYGDFKVNVLFTEQVPMRRNMVHYCEALETAG